MTSEAHTQPERDPLEDNELARRLRRMEWPPAPPEVKRRVLERVLDHTDGEPAPNGDGNGTTPA